MSGSPRPPWWPGPGTRCRSGIWCRGPPAATIHSRTAKLFESLGDRLNSARQYATAAAGRPGATYARIIALNLVAQAEQQAKQGGIEQACTTWGRAIDTMAGVKSTRTLKAVRSLRADLRPYRARGVRVAAELDERARLPRPPPLTRSRRTRPETSRRPQPSPPRQPAGAGGGGGDS
ncbi:hypothetical protein ACFTWD_04975 [Streptomyces sp. NPDC056943]|uniref:hypothetical protein n=1 Tax=Streptomyces sp. NPDC056943 TaxID=3345971 RepID=UPI00363399FB